MFYPRFVWVLITSCDWLLCCQDAAGARRVEQLAARPAGEQERHGARAPQRGKILIMVKTVIILRQWTEKRAHGTM